MAHKSCEPAHEIYILLQRLRLCKCDSPAYSLSAYVSLKSLFAPAHGVVVLIILSSAEASGEPVQICRLDRAFTSRINGTHIASHLHQRRFRRIYLSTNPSPHDPQNLLLAQTNRPMKTPGRIFSIIPSCQSD